jgi:hypothetical protein
MNIPPVSLSIEPATFLLLAQCLNKLRYRARERKTGGRKKRYRECGRKNKMRKEVVQSKKDGEKQGKSIRHKDRTCDVSNGGFRV